MLSSSCAWSTEQLEIITSYTQLIRKLNLYWSASLSLHTWRWALRTCRALQRAASSSTPARGNETTATFRAEDCFGKRSSRSLPGTYSTPGWPCPPLQSAWRLRGGSRNTGTCGTKTEMKPKKWVNSKVIWRLDDWTNEWKEWRHQRHRTSHRLEMHI